jgi:hypothetical protein
VGFRREGQTCVRSPSVRESEQGREREREREKERERERASERQRLCERAREGGEGARKSERESV